MANYSPPKLDNSIQVGWNCRESAMQLIWLLIFVNSLVFTYFIKIIISCSDGELFGVLIFSALIQIYFFYARFKSDLAPERIKQRKNDMIDVLKDVCEFSN